MKSTISALLLMTCLATSAYAVSVPCTFQPLDPKVPPFSTAAGGYGPDGYKYKALLAAGRPEKAESCKDAQPTNTFSQVNCDTQYKALYACKVIQ